MHQGFLAGAFDLRDLAQALRLDGSQQARGDRHLLAVRQVLLHLAHQRGVEAGRFGKQHRGRIGGEFGSQLDGDSEHPQEVVQEVLAGRMVRLVALHADWFTQFPQERVHLLEDASRISRDGVGSLRRSVAHGLQQLAEIEQRHLRGFGE